MKAWLDAILRGMASVFSFGATETPNLPMRSDADAIASDWRAVGDDLRAAVDRCRPGVPPAVDAVDTTGGAG